MKIITLSGDAPADMTADLRIGIIPEQDGYLSFKRGRSDTLNMVTFQGGQPHIRLPNGVCNPVQQEYPFHPLIRCYMAILKNVLPNAKISPGGCHFCTPIARQFIAENRISTHFLYEIAAMAE